MSDTSDIQISLSFEAEAAARLRVWGPLRASYSIADVTRITGYPRDAVTQMALWLGPTGEMREGGSE